ncbi:hypothetical protein [Geoglobus ahangari]
MPDYLACDSCRHFRALRFKEVVAGEEIWDGECWRRELIPVSSDEPACDLFEE